MLEVVDAFEKGKGLREVRGVSFRDERRVRVNPSRPPVKDLDTIPFPDPKFLSFEYLGTISGLRTAFRRFTSVITSRGCPYY